MFAIIASADKAGVQFPAPESSFAQTSASLDERQLEGSPTSQHTSFLLPRARPVAAATPSPFCGVDGNGQQAEDVQALLYAGQTCIEHPGHKLAEGTPDASPIPGLLVDRSFAGIVASRYRHTMVGCSSEQDLDPAMVLVGDSRVSSSRQDRVRGDRSR